MVLTLNGCTINKVDPRESWSPTIYAGDSESKSLKRDQGKESISCEDKRFDEMFCVFDRDLKTMLKRCIEKKEADQTWAWFRGKKSEEEKKASGDTSGSDKPSGDKTRVKSQTP